MDIENNEKKQEETTQQEGFQREVRRTPRPRIHTGQRPSFERPDYRRRDNDEGGFRPEGFGAALHDSAAPQDGYRPRNNYGEYGQSRGGYRPRQGQEGGYQPRQGGYQSRQGGYQPRQGQGGYQGGYQSRQGGYQPRQGQGGYQRQEGGYQSRQGGYQPRQAQGGYKPYQKPYGKPGSPYKKGPRQHTADYDPNAKYSMKKRIEYKEVN